VLKAEARVTLLDRAPNNIGYLRFNTHVAPLDNPDVRKAIAMAIDQQSMVSKVFAGFAAPATQFLPPGMLGYDDGTRAFQPYDPAGAMRLLDIANARSFQLELWYMPVARPYFPEPRRAAEAIAADLEKVGITVLLNTVDFTTYRDKFKRNEFQSWLYGWTGDNGDPDNFLCVFFCNTTQNGSWDDSTAQQAVRLIRDAAADTDPLRRADLYRQASRTIQRGTPAVPIVHADVPVAVSRMVSGYVPHPKGSEAFTLVQLGR
jgi:peptide/nickel transport system substrate-binding protein